MYFSIILLLIIIFYTNDVYNFPNLKLSPSRNVSRRIGGVIHRAKKYPEFVVAIDQFHPFKNIHRGMGTLLSNYWIISTKYCFRDIKENNLDASDIRIYHGNNKYSDCKVHLISQIVRHGGVDLALAKIDYGVKIASKYIPILSTHKCSSDIRGVFYSFGRTNRKDDTYSDYLLYELADTEEIACKDQQLNYMCIMPVDHSYALEGDRGAGFVTGWGPGPEFDIDNYDLRLLGVLSKEFLYHKPNGDRTVIAVVVRISEYADWIHQYIF